MNNQTNRELSSVELRILNDSIVASGLNYLDPGVKKQEVIDNNKVNVLTYQIINRTNKNLLFIVDQDNLIYDQFGIKDYVDEQTVSGNDVYTAGIFFDIRDSKNNHTKYYSFLGSDEKLKNNEFIDNETKLRLQELNYPMTNRAEYSELIRRNSFILHPNEYKVFQYVLRLPLEKESNKYNAVVSEFDLDESKRYNFKLLYFCDSKALKQTLPSVKLKELEDNDIEIYDGFLISDDIPIKFK
ncbi:hypothetical protein [Flavobacterium sp. SaA2.13]|uniref:hypothetical protein n=1 Tax=Flavobacterium sp. SaA2.13 TaxID=2691898 RepID=UPI00178C5065|nr:hypothetical protein [Flavobacterium sp. SaA2.13]